MPKRKQKSSTPILLAIGGGFLLIVAAILLATQNAPAAPTPAAAFEEETYPEISRVSRKDSKSAYYAGTAVFVDVRSSEAYQGGRITSAINIPLAKLEPQIIELDPNQWIITYCTWPNEESSAHAARFLLDNGFQNVTPILGGYEAWINAGYPVEP